MAKTVREVIKNIEENILWVDKMYGDGKQTTVNPYETLGYMAQGIIQLHEKNPELVEDIFPRVFGDK